jgi:hypothetical protein
MLFKCLIALSPTEKDVPKLYPELSRLLLNMSLDAVEYGFHKDTLKTFLETISSGNIKNMCTRARAVAEDATRILLDVVEADEKPTQLSQRLGVLGRLFQVRQWLVSVTISCSYIRSPE